MNFLTDLLEHQKRCVEKLRRIKIGALYMEMGTGKTRTALELINIRLEKQRIEHVIWLCPCSVKENLRRDIIFHTGQDYKDLITICGIETLSSSIRANSYLLSLVETKQCFIIVDESNLVKNFTCKRTKNIIRIAEKCKYKLILNGTPISKNEADLFAQWYVLDWRVLGYKSYWSFAANHLEYSELIPGKLVRCLNVDYLAEKIAPYTYQVKKEECLDLPEKTYETIYYNLTKEQDEHYEEVANKLFFYVDELEPNTIYRLFSGLQSVISGYKVDVLEETYEIIDERDVHEQMKIKKTRIVGTRKSDFFSKIEDNPRIQTLLEIVKKIDDKIIIFAKYTDEINNIIKILNNTYGKDSAVAFNGKLSQKRRNENLDKFRNESRFLVANKNCGSYGLNLQFCNYVIYYSNDWDYGTRVQSEDRVHRIGQNKNVHLIDICAAYTLDERIIKCLEKKENLLNAFKKEIENTKDNEELFSWITVRTSFGSKFKYKNKKIKNLDRSDLIENI
ncbi:DEAD/DEAH box helicase [uncultured Clostridium sp.]|uniref:helicase-related protein n=1 Tax=uncultured Clostridium sp. TaxID=59620 RepID=UPI0026262307|nr:DEAD/DEAH box helicase [uncultured Clostridium sp.]